MRVLVVEHKEIFGGGQVALLNVAREWARQNAPMQVALVCPPNAALAPRARSRGIKTFAFPLGRIEKTKTGLWNGAQRVVPTWRLLQTLRRTRAEVILANGAFSFLASVLAAKLARVPLVWWEHNTTLPNDAMLKRMITWAHHIIVVSETIQAQFTQLVPTAREKIAVIYNGVDTETFCKRETRAACLREWNWDEHARIVGTVSRLAPEKGVDFFVAAAREIVRAEPQARFVIAGDGALRAELQARAADAPIRFLGAREDIPDVLNALDVFVMPSRAEAFGIAAVEAMACELPVVASAVGGLREVILNAETGLLVPVGDVRALANAILELLRDENKRRAMGERGRARVLEHFALAAQARAMGGVLRGG